MADLERIYLLGFTTLDAPSAFVEAHCDASPDPTSANARFLQRPAWRRNWMRHDGLERF